MSQPIRAGVLSAGAWSESSHLPALSRRDDVDLVVVSRPDRDRAADAARRFGARHVETEWRGALAHGLDVVVVSSPPSAHEDMVIAALAAGAHVLCEKPFALTSASAWRMVAAARAHDRELLVGFGWAATPLFVRARAAVAAGALGQIEHASLHLIVPTRRLLSGGADGGWGGRDASEPSTYVDPTISGGGTAAVSMSHQIGMLLWLVDRKSEEVIARTFPASGAIDLHDSAIVTLAGAVPATVSCVSTHPATTRPEWYVSIQGSESDLWLDTSADRWRRYGADGSVEETQHPGDGAYDATAPTDALVDVAAGRLDMAPTGMSGLLAARVVEVTEALYASATTGRPVALDHCDNETGD
jgi:predicted dehydrogenase